MPTHPDIKPIAKQASKSAVSTVTWPFRMAGGAVDFAAWWLVVGVVWSGILHQMYDGDVEMTFVDVVASFFLTGFVRGMMK